jgi:hypothetical protein
MDIAGPTSRCRSVLEEDKLIAHEHEDMSNAGRSLLAFGRSQGCLLLYLIYGVTGQFHTTIIRKVSDGK